jgi:hypothetical protein
VALSVLRASVYKRLGIFKEAQLSGLLFRAEPRIQLTKMSNPAFNYYELWPFSPSLSFDFKSVFAARQFGDDVLKIHEDDPLWYYIFPDHDPPEDRLNRLESPLFDPSEDVFRDLMVPLGPLERPGPLDDVLEVIRPNYRTPASNIQVFFTTSHCFHTLNSNSALSRASELICYSKPSFLLTPVLVLEHTLNEINFFPRSPDLADDKELAEDEEARRICRERATNEWLEKSSLRMREAEANQERFCVELDQLLFDLQDVDNRLKRLHEDEDEDSEGPALQYDIYSDDSDVRSKIWGKLFML